MSRHGPPRRAFERLVASNRRWSKQLEARVPHAIDHSDVWAGLVTQQLNARPGQLVVDVGGGRSCPYAADRRRPGTRIVAVDISDDELRLNPDADETRVADVVRGLPFAPGEVDLLVSRSTIEHLADAEAFIRNSRAVMSDGGCFVHGLPCRFAPFALANRLLPHRLARRLLALLLPWSDGILGFRAYYDRCYPSAMVRIVEANGFEVDRVAVVYYQAHYFDFLFPLYVANLLYERMLRALGLRDLCAYFVITGRAVSPDAGPAGAA